MSLAAKVSECEIVDFASDRRLLPDRELFVDAKPVAELCDCSRAYVLKLALLDKIPCYRLPPMNGTSSRVRWRFKLSEVEEWMKRRASQ